MVKRKIAAAIVQPPALPEYFDDTDFVDRLFAYMLHLVPELAPRAADIKGLVRKEFGGEWLYVRQGRDQRARQLQRTVARMFDGRNASEIARLLGISRATVYRCLKQAGEDRP